MARGSCDSDICAGDLNGIKAGVRGSSECLSGLVFLLLERILEPTVVPSNVTVVPLIRLVSRIVELAGAEMLSRIILVHEATADVI